MEPLAEKANKKKDHNNKRKRDAQQAGKSIGQELNAIIRLCSHLPSHFLAVQAEGLLETGHLGE